MLIPGYLMTADGSDDKLIQPEGLSDYLVPPPSILDPAPQPAATNTPSPATVIDDDQEEDVQMTFEDELVEGMILPMMMMTARTFSILLII